MFPEERHRKILSILEQQTAVSVADLRRELGVNAMMLWRDLRLLSEQGVLKRVRGGAQQADVDREASYQMKQRTRATVKTQLARLAVERFVHDGDIVILEGGTTVAEVATLLFDREVTVLTNSLSIAQRLYSGKARCTVYLSGGLLRMQSGTFVGREAVTFFPRRKAKVFFMSATGLEETRGFTDPNPQEIEVKQAMIRSAEKVVALIDASKIGVNSLMQVTAIRKVNYLISDADADKLAWLSGKGIEVLSPL